MGEAVRGSNSPKHKLKSQDLSLLVVQFSQALQQQLQLSISHLGANRIYQARLYSLKDNPEIQTIANAYEQLGIQGDFGSGFLEEWLERFEIGETVRIDWFENTAIRIAVRRGDKRVNLADLGYGAGQLLTILLQLAALVQLHFQRLESGETADDRSPLILIEEPEANLHPQLQSLLAELFAEAAQRYGLRFILETHSEYLIRNIQVLVKERQLLDLFKVYYFDKPSEANGQQYGHEMRLREDGIFMDGFGEGFLMNESANLTFKLF